MKRFFCGLMLSAVGLVPVYAGPVLWTFGDTGSTTNTPAPGVGTSTAVFTSGYNSPPDDTFVPLGTTVSLSGSFIYNSDTGPDPIDALGAFSAINLSVTGLQALGVPVTDPVTTWYADEPLDQSASTSGTLYFTDADPNANPDLTDVGGSFGPGGNPAFLLAIGLNSEMGDIVGPTAILNGGGGGGYCVNAECNAVNTSFNINYLDSVSPTAYIYGTVVSVSAAPEPSTFVLFGSVLIAVGLSRRKLFSFARKS